MAYLGNVPAEAYTSIDKQVITGDGGTSYTLDHSVANENEIEVFVNNVRQEPSVAYTVSGTTLTMTGDVESTDDFYVVFQGKAIQTTAHPEGQDLKARDGTFSGDVAVDTDTLYVDATNDRVGVNTSSPARDLEVTGGTQGLVRISGSTNGGAVECWDGTNGIYFGSNPAITGTGNSGDLAVYVDTGKVQTYWTGGAERMRIDNSGNVGIGTTSPGRPLHVKNASPNLRLEDSDGSGAYADIGADTSGSLYLLADHSSSASSSRIRFYIDGLERGQMEANGSLFLNSEGSGGLRVNLRQGSSKSWARINSSFSVFDTYNITSITDSGTGRATYNHNNNMNNANYETQIGCDNNINQIWASTYTTGSVLGATYTGSSYSDQGQSMNTHGDLA